MAGRPERDLDISAVHAHREALIATGEAMPDTALGAAVAALAGAPWPEDLRTTPLIIDTSLERKRALVDRVEDALTADPELASPALAEARLSAVVRAAGTRRRAGTGPDPDTAATDPDSDAALLHPGPTSSFSTGTAHRAGSAHRP